MSLRAIASSLSSSARWAFPILFARHYDVRYLQSWRLTRQRQHLVHSDPGSDRCIAQAGLANRLLHALAPSSATLASIAARLFFRSAML
jgi:hypothetical protein